jgi:ATP-binding cassette subfamily B protein
VTAPLSDDTAPKGVDRALIGRLLRYVRPYRAVVAGALALLVLEGLLQLVPPLLTRYVIDTAIPAHDAPGIRNAALLFITVLFAQFGFEYGSTLLTTRLGQAVMHDLRREVFAVLQRLPIAYYDRTPVGRLVTRVTSDIESLNELFTSGVVAGIGDLATLAAIAALMVSVDWRLTLAAFGVVPLIILTSAVFRVKVRDTYRDIRGRIARINAFLQERLTGIRVVQLFGRERAEGERFYGLNKEHLDAHLKSVTVYALYFPAIEILTTVALASLIVVALPRVAGHVLTVGTVAAFLQLARRFFQPLQDLSDKYNTLQQAMAASERIFAVVDEGKALVPEPPVTAARRRAVTIAFEGVWFHYGDAPSDGTEPAWVLRDVSFVARPGETVALVGHTGAGKTTIISLLLRFYDPQRGRITVDGVDARTLPVAELRALIGYVQQDIFLFAGDVATNIRLSAPISDEAVRTAAARVGADRVIERLPEGYAHVLGERGSSVSVGERQLLSFARAIAADPAVLLLDEATSAVDSNIEADIQRALAELMRGRTTIAVAHRLSTIVGATEILVLHHGEIRERGTHRTLLERKGLYDRLYRLQAGESGVLVTP